MQSFKNKMHIHFSTPQHTTTYTQHAGLKQCVCHVSYISLTNCIKCNKYISWYKGNTCIEIYTAILMEIFCRSAPVHTDSTHTIIHTSILLYVRTRRHKRTDYAFSLEIKSLNRIRVHCVSKKLKFAHVVCLFMWNSAHLAWSSTVHVNSLATYCTAAWPLTAEKEDKNQNEMTQNAPHNRVEFCSDCCLFL